MAAPQEQQEAVGRGKGGGECGEKWGRWVSDEAENLGIGKWEPGIRWKEGTERKRKGADVH